MSKIFYDHLLIFENFEVEIKKAVPEIELREELWAVVDEMIHHRVITTILKVLPNQHHEEFLAEFTKRPHDERLLGYLTDKSGQDAEVLIKKELADLLNEIISDLKK